MNDELTIITNNVPRLVIDAYELSTDERKEFSYIDWAAVERGETQPTFVRYKGELIDLGDLDSNYSLGGARTSPFKDWDGYRSDSFFSGIVIRYVRDGENYEGPVIDWDHVIVGRYYS